MSKQLIVIVATVSLLYACDERDYSFAVGSSVHTEPATALVKDTAFHDQSVLTPGNRICIAKFICKTTQKNYGPASLTSYFESDVSNEENITSVRVVLQRSRTDSIVLTNNGVSTWSWPEEFSLPPNATIPVSMYIAVRAPVSGTIMAKLEIAHSNSAVSTDIVSGQMITLR